MIRPPASRRPPAKAAALGALALGIATAAPAAPLRYAEDRAPGIVNPLFTRTMAEARLDELVFSGLFTDARDLTSTPDLVDRFEVAPDRRSMTLTLRSDVRWHDGTPLTAEDVAFTIRAMQAPATASTEAGRVAWIAGVEVLGPLRLRLDFVGPEIAPEDKLHFKILPAHAFDGVEVSRAHPFRTRPIGTGPFRIEAFASDGSIVLAPHEGYPRPIALDGVVMREVADKSYQAKLLVYQSLEALVRVVPRDLATLEADRGVELYPYQTNSWWYIGMNQRDPVLSDPRVREALARLVDVEELLRPVGTGAVITGPYVPSSPFYNHDVPRTRHDPDTARTLLREAGFSFDGSAWVRDGAPLVLTLVARENVEVAQDVVVALQAQLGRYGVQVEPTFLGPAAWTETVWRDGAFDLVLSQWSFDRNEDIRAQFHSTGARNFVHYANPAVDDLLDRARGTVDPQEKRRLLQAAHAAIAADRPMIFLWTLDSYAAVSVRVKDVQIHPFTFFTWARDWRVE